MTTFLQFAILGLGTGAAYALLSQGLLLIHRGSGVVNFAHGAMAMAGAYLFYEFHVVRGVPIAGAAVIAILLTTLLGILVYQVVMRPLAGNTPVARAIATLGLLLVLQGVCNLIWGEMPKQVPSLFPTELVRFGDIVIGADRFFLVGIAAVITLGLWLLLHYTRGGIALRANAENPVAAATLGWSSHLMGTFTWGLGAALAASAGILIAPLTGLNVDLMPLLVIPALAAALIGRFRSFPITLAAALLLGVMQSLASRYIQLPGVTEALPFIVILLTLVVGTKAIRERRQASETLPALGSGALHPVAIFVTLAVLSGLVFILPAELTHALTATIGWGIIMLSVVVLLGYTGQLSLAQAAIAGMGALIAGRVVSDLGAPFLVALLVGVLAAVPIGVLFALPALRTKGVNLAVVTLGLAVATSAMIFNNSAIAGGANGTPVGYPTLFGLEIDASLHPERYAIVVFAIFALAAVLITNVRRGAAGRRLMAVRTNERAASALGVGILGAKLYAFGFAAAIAALGGILVAFRNPYVLYEQFVPLTSILVVAYTVVGGVGYVFGAFNGGTLIAGGLGAWIMHSLVPGASPVWLHIIGGVLVTTFVIVLPNGLVYDQIKIARRLRAVFITRKPAAPPLPAEGAPVAVHPATLAVEGLTVRYGGVVALDDVTLTVTPGEVLGLIGPNGAGKTTLIDAVTGFVSPSAGVVTLDDTDISAWPVHRRARAGVSRSFQSLELFETSTVRENLQIASDPVNTSYYFRDIVAPAHPPLSEAAIAAVRLLGLEAELDATVADLSYGRRRLVAIARAVAASPSVLLLDEPAAGLSSDETTALGEAVRTLARSWGIAVLVVEHDMSFVMNVCDQVTVIDFGRQIGYGSPAEIQKDPAVVAAYLGTPAEPTVPTAPAPRA